MQTPEEQAVLEEGNDAGRGTAACGPHADLFDCFDYKGDEIVAHSDFR